MASNRDRRWGGLIAAFVIGGVLVGGGVTAGVLLSRGEATGSTEKADDSTATISTGEGESPTAQVALTPFEEEVVGGWSRYHSYDGSSQYVLLQADRTACRWERTASGSLTEDWSYSYWELRDNGDGSFSIWWRADPEDELWQLFLYKYAEDELIFGASNLIGGRDPDVVACFD